MSLTQTGTDLRSPLRVRVLQSGATLGGQFKYVNLVDVNGNIQAPGMQTILTLLAASGAITPGTPAAYMITLGSAAALTLAAPAVGTDDGKVIEIFSTTAFAHVLTATGLLKTGASAVNTATFAAVAGASLTLMAYNGLWYVQSQIQITFA